MLQFGIHFYPSQRELLKVASVYKDFNVGDCESTSIAYLPDQSLIIVADQAGRFHQMDMRNMQSPINSFQGHETAISETSFDPDRNKIFSSSVDGTVKIWDVGSFTSDKPVGLTLNHALVSGEKSGISGIRCVGNAIFTCTFDGEIYRAEFPN